MNKKTISVIVSMLMFLNTVGIVFADKKDVSDPVLKEIIAELSNKMPRFINKYGAAVFVADEQITRASLLQALYEYDKKSSSSSSASSAGVITKRDYDVLNTKISALERNIKAGGVASVSARNAGGSVDIVQIMNDLEPNMPMMLDNSLASSKVFKELQQKVNSVGAGTAAVSVAGSSVGGVSLSAFNNLQKNVDSLNKKVNNVELTMASSKTAGASTGASSVSSAAVSNLQKDVLALNKKVDTLAFNQSAGSPKTKSGQTVNAQVLSDLQNVQKEIDAVNSKINSMEIRLASSKETSSVAAAPSNKEIDELRKSIIQMQQSYVSIGKRVNSLEREGTLSASSSNVSDKQLNRLNNQINSIRETVENIPTDNYIKSEISKSNSKASADIKKIEKRLNSLESSKNSSSSGSSSGSSSAGTVAKISLGLTMVAALFIAR